MFDEESRLRRRRRKWRGEWIANFAERQRIAKGWVAFVDLADWCARSTTAAGIDEEERARDLAFRRLADSILKGEFERESRSQLLYLDPRVMGDGASPRCRLTREQAEIAFALPPAVSLSLTVLGCCWLPRELARHWLESHGYRWCPNFEPAPSPADAHTGESDNTRKPTGNPRRAKPGPIPTADRIKNAAEALLAAGRVSAETIPWSNFGQSFAGNSRSGLSSAVIALTRYKRRCVLFSCVIRLSRVPKVPKTKICSTSCHFHTWLR